jgi:threonyl-tRNA synthetase
MRLLLLHCDFIEYVPIEKEIELAEADIQKKSVRIENLIVVFTSIEASDDDNVINNATNDIEDYANSVKCPNLLIYPYSHLSSNLAPASIALNFFKNLKAQLQAKNTFENIHSAPFGWTKSFNIKVKGHPLAEHAKEITTKKSGMGSQTDLSQNDFKPEPAALKMEKTLKSSWYMMEPEGNLISLEKHTFVDGHNGIKLLFNHEVTKDRSVDQVPPHVRLMKKLGIADYEFVSDSGNMRYYPKGKLMKSLIELYVTKKVIEYGALEVETPIMYDSNFPPMQSYFHRFPARQYNIKSDNKQLFLRFAACFGQFLMARDFLMSYKNLPVKLYELTRYSFRREKSGEIVGLRRLRAFTMPDCHAFCKDIDQAKIELMKRLGLSMQTINDLGLSPHDDVEMALRLTKGFYEENVEFIRKLIRKFNKPVLLEVWDERFFYFVLKWEFHFIDNLGKTAALSTDQMDVENAERYGINFVDEDGVKKYPIILHNSPSGAIERVIYALLEKAAREAAQGKSPYLPLWLTHTQIRLIPVTTKHTIFCEKILNVFYENNLRADIDDRDLSVAKKIRESEMEWIHYTLVIGDKESSSNELLIRDRMSKSQYTMSLEEFIAKLSFQLKDKPFLPLNLPNHLSQRPQIMA